MAKPKLRKMLGDVNSPEVTKLMRLIETQSLKTLANWAIEYAGTTICRYSRPSLPAMAARALRSTAAVHTCRANFRSMKRANR